MVSVETVVYNVALRIYGVISLVAEFDASGASHVTAEKFIFRTHHVEWVLQSFFA